MFTRIASRVAAAAIACAIVFAASTHGQSIALAAIHGYQRSLAPLAARAGARCRFTPTCSRYAEIVIARDGVVRGGWEAMKRIARCGPWTPDGTTDNP